MRLRLLIVLALGLLLFFGAILCKHFRSERTSSVHEELSSGVMVGGWYFFKYPHLERIREALPRIDGKSIVIDIKNADGRVMAPLSISDAQFALGGRAPIGDFWERLEGLKRSGYAVIVYLVVFKDRLFANRFPEEAVRNSKGLPFDDNHGVSIDPASARYQQYMLELISSLSSQPFIDEVMLDYVRYPEYEGLRYPHTKSSEPRTRVIVDFVRRVADVVHAKGKRLSVTVFPPQPQSVSVGYLLGQDYARLAEVADVMSPMIYPQYSAIHAPGKYPDYSKRQRDDNWEAYFQEVCSVTQRFTRPGRLRPWIQGFYVAQEANKRGRILRRYSSPLPWPRMKWQIDFLKGKGIPFLVYNSRSEYVFEAVSPADRARDVRR